MLICLKYLSLFLIFPISYLNANPLCIKAKDSKQSMIYLHGIDDPKLSHQEQENRLLMRKISKQKNIDISIPRGNELCDKKICWQHQTEKMLQDSWTHILQFHQSCSPNSKLVSIVGFSNGGYLAGKLFQDCIIPKTTLTIVAGATISEQDKKLKSCWGPIGFLIGSSDQIKSKANSSYLNLNRLGAKGVWKEFKGGHQLQLAGLLQLIAK